MNFEQAFGCFCGATVIICGLTLLCYTIISNSIDDIKETIYCMLDDLNNIKQQQHIFTGKCKYCVHYVRNEHIGYGCCEMLCGKCVKDDFFCNNFYKNGNKHGEQN